MMSKFYTHVAQYGNNILFRGYNNGKRIQTKIPYHPYLFVPSRQADAEYRTLDDQPVDRMPFNTIKEAKEFLARYEDVTGFKIYGLTNWKYLFLNDLFPAEVPYDVEQISVVTIDIEVKLPKSGFDRFIEDAKEPVTALTMRRGDRILVFGYKEPYKPTDKNVHYVFCKDEHDLLARFIQAWNSDGWQPDVVTGWNVEFFDIPYLVNRITKVLGQHQARKLSPWEQLFEKTLFVMGREQQTYVPLGISILDCMQLYKKFTYTQQESYALNHIAYVELGEKKIDFSEYENLDDLYENDYRKYLEYNIKDVNLVHRLNEKKKLLDLIFVMAYDNKVNFNDSLGSVLPWEIVIHNYLMSFKTVVPLKEKHHKTVAYEGAYVKEPISGLHEWVVSFDLTSLYPHLIIQYNISPETFRGRNENVSVEKLLGGKITNDSEYSMAANGCLYDRVRIGFLPALMQKYFSKRTEYRLQKVAWEKRKAAGEEVGDKIDQFQTAQMAMKIFLNSAYGAVGNQWFMFYDSDNAEAITLSGQLSIRWVEKHINSFINNKLGTENEDFVVAMDTDSIYLNLAPIVHRYLHSGDDCIDTVDTLSSFSEKVIQPEIDRAYRQLAEIMNAKKNAMVMKREVIASKGIWKAKKMYVLYVLDSEGIRYKEPELKMMGIEAIRSSVPECCRRALKESLKIILTEDNETLIKYVEDFRKRFDEMPFSDIAFPRGVNGLTKYTDHQTIYAKGTPIHTKGSLIYNNLLKKHKLNMTPIYDGDKIKFAYLKVPNPLHQTVIASPGYLPKEFGAYEYIDRNMQFEKAYLQPLRSITDVIGWKTEEMYTIEDFFG